MELLEGCRRPAREPVQALADPFEPSSMGQLHDQHAGDACLLCLSRSEKALVLGGEIPERVLHLGHANSIANCYTIRRGPGRA